MHLEPFEKWLPELARKECRSIELVPGSQPEKSQIPSGKYLFMEYFCADPKCDCRRVSLVVVDGQTGKPQATISYAFDRDAPLAGPYVDRLNRAVAYADEFVELAEAFLFSDREYVDRLERHYYLLKEAVGMPPHKLRLRVDPAQVAETINQKKATRKQHRKLLEQRRRRPWS